MGCCTPREKCCCSATQTSHRQSRKPKSCLRQSPQGADIAIGSRWLRTELQTRKQPIHRQIYGRLYNLALRLVLGLNFKDTQCGFKAFSRGAAQCNFSAAKRRTLGLRPGVALSGAEIRLQDRGDSGELGASRGHSLKPIARWLFHAAGNVQDPLEFVERQVRNHPTKRADRPEVAVAALARKSGCGTTPIPLRNVRVIVVAQSSHSQKNSKRRLVLCACGSAPKVLPFGAVAVSQRYNFPLLK